MRTDKTNFLIFYWTSKIIFYNMINRVEIFVYNLGNKIFGDGKPFLIKKVLLLCTRYIVQGIWIELLKIIY